MGKRNPEVVDVAMLMKAKEHCVPREPQIHQDQHTHRMPFSLEQLRFMGYAYARVFASGEVWAVAPYSISNGRLFIDVDGCGYRDFYCFCDYSTALRALVEFDPSTMTEPEGWHRHYATMRRRENGDPARETRYA